ncbi:hypothetical protein L9F63_019223, partial [Diploptera punctata]
GKILPANEIVNECAYSNFSFCGQWAESWYEIRITEVGEKIDRKTSRRVKLHGEVRITPPLEMKFIVSPTVVKNISRRLRLSEEEIDVVSIADREKLTTLPTNPSAQDKQQLQKTVATAIHQQKRSRSREQIETPPEEQQIPETSNKRRRTAKPETTEDNDCERRHQHNNMERLRRIDLRENIARLRVLIPAIAKNDRAAKVTVLKEAVKYINSLEEIERKSEIEKAKLSKLQLVLKAKVRNLRLGNAKCRGFISADHLPLLQQWVPPPEEEKVHRKKRMGS